MERQSEQDIEALRSRLIESFRNELPVLRAKARVSQELLAEKVGISRQTYSSIETGKREVTWTTFLALTAYFQNNEQTAKMLGLIEGFNEGLSEVMQYEPISKKY